MKKNNNLNYAEIDSISIKTHKNVLHVTFLTETALMILSLCSCALIAFPPLNIIGNPSLILSIILVPIVITFLFSVSGKIIKPISIIGSILFLLGLIWFKREDLLNGLLYIYDGFVKQMNLGFGTNYITFSDVHTSAYQTMFVNLTMTVLTALLSTIFGYIIIIAKSPLLLGLIYCPFIYMSVNFTSKPPILALAIFTFAIVTLMGLRVSTKRYKGTPIGKSFSKNKQNIYISDSSYRVRDAMPSCVTISAVTLICAGLILAFVPISSYNPDRSANNRLSSIITPLLKNNSLSTLFSKTSNAGIGSGRLGESDSISYQNQLHLLVNSSQRKPMLLKGYVGDYYDNNTWKSDTPMNYSKDIFERFYKANSSVHLFSSQYPAYLSQNQMGGKSSAESVHVQNVHANGNYAYLPYSYYSAPFINNQKNNNLDLWVTPVGDSKDTYTSWYYNFEVENDKIYTKSGVPILSDYVTSYTNSLDDYHKKLNNDYTKYVYNTYTAMPNIDTQKRGYNIALTKLNTAMRNGVNIAKAGQEDYSKSEIDNTVEWIKEYLFSNTEYSLSPGRTSDNTDFIYKFLRDGEGYCMHYATTATIMLRSVGIPARFVEGYTITEHDYITAEQNGTDTLQIYDTNAHAWVEVFINDVGWVPYEVTPGFSGQQISSSNLENLPEPPPPIEVIPPDLTPPSLESSDINQDILSSEISSEESSDSDTSSDESNANGVGNNTNDDGNPTVIVWLMIMLAVIVVIVGIYIRRKLIWQSKNRKFNSRDLNKATISLFVQCQRLLQLLGRTPDDFNDLESFAENVETYTIFIEKNTFKIVVAIAQKAQFSNHMVSQDEYNTVKQFEKSLRVNTANKIGRLKRFIYKWIIIVL